MPSDPTRPLLRLDPPSPDLRRPGRPAPVPPPRSFDQATQARRIGGTFQRLADLLERDPSGLALRADPSGLAPERLLVFEVTGPVQAFARAVAKVQGLDQIGRASCRERG